MPSIDPYELDQAVSTMEKAGLSATMPRLAVWLALERSDTPLLVIDLHRYLLSREMSVALSSVYAALKCLTEAGLVAAHTFDGGKTYYTPMSRRCRHRIVCKHSGNEHWMGDGLKLQHIIEKFCLEQGFQLRDYTLSVQVWPIDENTSKTNKSRSVTLSTLSQ